MGATPPPSINLFTCTLGEAHVKGITAFAHNRYRTVNQFIDYQARYYGDCPALAYPELREDWVVQIFTFRQLRSISLHVAQYLDIAGNGNSPISFDTELETQKVVGLLGLSNLDLLFTWLALMRKGVSVLLLA
jgi:acyl-CoA synthetase (AMP-forming)/AMP-acid ligase II